MDWTSWAGLGQGNTQAHQRDADIRHGWGAGGDMGSTIWESGTLSGGREWVLWGLHRACLDETSYHLAPRSPFHWAD